MVLPCVSATVCYTVSGVTNVSHQVDHLSSLTALQVNEVREPQSTQSTPLSPTWTNREAWAITPLRLLPSHSAFTYKQKTVLSTTSLRREEAAVAHTGNSVAFTSRESLRVPVLGFSERGNDGGIRRSFVIWVTHGGENLRSPAFEDEITPAYSSENDFLCKRTFWVDFFISLCLLEILVIMIKDNNHCWAVMRCLYGRFLYTFGYRGKVIHLFHFRSAPHQDYLYLQFNMVGIYTNWLHCKPQQPTVIHS